MLPPAPEPEPEPPKYIPPYYGDFSKTVAKHRRFGALSKKQFELWLRNDAKLPEDVVQKMKGIGAKMLDIEYLVETDIIEFGVDVPLATQEQIVREIRWAIRNGVDVSQKARDKMQEERERKRAERSAVRMAEDADPKLKQKNRDERSVQESSSEEDYGADSDDEEEESGSEEESSEDEE